MDRVRSFRILVVDDDVVLLQLHAEVLASFGFTVSTAENGQQAWDFLRSNEVDVVFTDVRMPVMDGFELLKKIRSRHRTSPCVIMTSGHADYPADFLFHNGANGFLDKPVSASTVRNAIARAVCKMEDLWIQPSDAEPVATITKEADSIQEMSAKGMAHFGRGGFFVETSGPWPQVRSTVAFQFTFKAGSTIEELKGTGTVQWIHAVESPERPRGLGIEIKHLDDPGRVPFCEWVRAQGFEAFIPMK